MPFTIHVTRDFDQMSALAADIVAADIKEKQAGKPEYVPGLATGDSPTGLYKHLAKAFNAGVVDPTRVRTLNLDEYVGLPGENAQQRALHRESYSYFMTTELFGLMRRDLAETNGARRTGPVAESILGEVTCDVPISYGQQYAAGGGDMVYVLDEAAAADVLDAWGEVSAKGYQILDHRGEPYSRVADVTFSRDAESGLVG
jgi:hypothetical protein